MSSSVVYEIVCTSTDQRYIGSTTRFYKRLLGHFRALRLGKHPNPHLQHVYDLYGEESFTVNILETCSSENILEREQHYIVTLHPELNIALDASAPMKGRKKTAESIEKSASKLRGRPQTEDAIAARSKALTGRKRSDLEKEAISKGTKEHALRGTSHPSAKLTELQIQAILDIYGDYYVDGKFLLTRSEAYEIGAVFGISGFTVRRIIKNRGYRE